MATHKLQKLNYRNLYCTGNSNFLQKTILGEDPIFPVSELLYKSPQSKGWSSAKFCEYPQEIIFQFSHLSRLEEVQILIHQSKIPTKIELYTFLPSGLQAVQGELPLNKIKFEYLGYMAFDSNQKTKFQARELKSSYTDTMCFLFKLLIYENHQNKVNIFNQVSIISINCLGEYYIPPNGIREPLLMGGRFEEEMQYDVSTIEKLKQLYDQKKKAVENNDFEKAQKVKIAIDRMKAIGIKLNELVEQKQSALKKNDFNLAKKFKDEIDSLRHTVISTQLNFSDTKEQIQPRNFQQKMNYRSIENLNSQQQLVRITTENILNDRRNYEQPILDKDKLIFQEEQIRDKINQKRGQIDRNFKKQVGNKEPITVEELVHQTNEQKQIAFEEQVIPAIKSQRQDIQQPEENEEFYQNLQTNTEPEELDEQSMKLAQPLIPVFGMKLMQKIFSHDWHIREEGINQIMEEVSLGTKSKICGDIDQERLFTACIGVISNTVSDKIAQVSLSSMKFLDQVCNKQFASVGKVLQHELNKYVDNTCIWLLDKIGENNTRLREKAEQSCLSIVSHPSISASIMINHITKGIIKKSSKNSVKHLNGRLQVLKKIIELNHVKENKLLQESCIEYAISQLQNSNGDVRASAYGVLISLYQQFGKVIKNQFFNMRPAQLDIIERALQQIDIGNIEKAYQIVANPTSHTQNQVSKSINSLQPKNQLEINQPNVYQSQQNLPNKKSQTNSNSVSQSQQKSHRIPQCQFCQEEDEDYDRDEIIDLHYAKNCKFLTECSLCSQIIDIPYLKNHWQQECQSKDQLQECQRCKEILHKKDIEKHTVDRKCKPAVKNEINCPLCKFKIPIIEKSIEKGWHQHIVVEGCPQNPRK